MTEEFTKAERLEAISASLPAMVDWVGLDELLESLANECAKRARQSEGKDSYSFEFYLVRLVRIHLLLEELKRPALKDIATEIYLKYQPQ
jgi:hypothetical protein